MPGIGFLFKKPWHPQTMENQKKLFVAEHSEIDRKNREEEAAKEVAREVEIQRYENAGDMESRDPKASSLKFMYSHPDLKSNSSALQNFTAPNSLEDDDDVKRFWKKIKAPNQELNSRIDSDLGDSLSRKKDDSISSINKTDSSVKVTVRQQSVLEMLVGKKSTTPLSREEIEQRHPRLKNAPVQGEYAKNLEIHHKPFAEPIRNVKCIRCGQWGHQAGDRECALLQAASPYDLARQRKEDPLNFMKGDGVIKEVYY